MDPIVLTILHNKLHKPVFGEGLKVVGYEVIDMSNFVPNEQYIWHIRNITFRIEIQTDEQYLEMKSKIAEWIEEPQNPIMCKDCAESALAE